MQTYVDRNGQRMNYNLTTSSENMRDRANDPKKGCKIFHWESPQLYRYIDNGMPCYNFRVKITPNKNENN